jgi:hypothetical protein
LNKDQLFHPSKFLQTRSKQFANQLQEKTNDTSKNQADIMYDIFTAIKEFFLTIGKPTFKKRKVYQGSPPSSADINNSFIEIYNDTRLMSDEQVVLGDAFKQSFNHSTTERLRLRNKIVEVGEKVNDYIVTATNTISKRHIIQDSFTNTSKVDLSSVGNPANVDTNHGMVTLKINGQINQSKNAVVIPPDSETPIEAKPRWPYTMPSNFLVAYKKESASAAKIQMFMAEEEAKQEDQWELYYTSDRHDNIQTILDGKPDTWFEYQMINVKPSLKLPGANPNTEGYGWTWDSGESIYNGDRGDSLDASIVIQLAGPTEINWVEFYPYFPAKSCSVIVKDIKTSMNNSGDYVSILDPSDRNRRISSDTAPPLSVKDREKFIGKGVWSFEERTCRYIKFELSVPEPYNCPIAHIYWELEYDVVTKKRRLFRKRTHTEHYVKRIDGPKIDKGSLLALHQVKDKSLELYLKAEAIIPGIGGIIGGILGAISGLFCSTKVSIKDEKTRMGLDVYTGDDAWRWCLGIRNIDINTNTYEESATLMTKTFDFPKGIRTLSLSVSEFIPEKFYGSNLTLKNSFIKYYVSHDGNVWTPISPIERTPAFGESDFPPKTISFVDKEPEVKNANKSFVLVNEDVKTIKMMAEIKRPSGTEFRTMTPIIYDYKISIVAKEVDAPE